MRSLSSTIERLAALRGRRSPEVPAAAGRLVALTDFGSNPGALGAWYYVPETLAPGAPLVVVLHGCTQNAAVYDHGSGWSQLAEEHGFALLFPEQRRANNFNLCFNWFKPDDSRRGAGEPLSIVQMIAAMEQRHALDPARVYVNGLSAGGAMTSVMLATYPEIFAGGAIIAGLAFATASSVPEALARMRGHGGAGEGALANAVRSASSHIGPWPSVSVWHGSADHVVDASNGDAILAQWRSIHGIAPQPDRSDRIDGYPHRLWHDAAGRTVLEEYRITGMGHGTPLAAGGDDGIGASGPHMLEVGISSTHHIARSWRLLGDRRRAVPVAAGAEAIPAPTRIARAEPGIAEGGEMRAASAATVTKVIEDALRAAGLMK